MELDEHVCGLFPRATWLQLIGEAGFEVRPVPSCTTNARRCGGVPGATAVAIRPGSRLV